MLTTPPALRRHALFVCAVLSITASGVAAQATARGPLTLDDAIGIATRNNPTYLQSTNDHRVADWDVRNAYSAFLPSISANTGVSWQGGGEQRFGSLTLGDLGYANQPSYYFSNYGLSLGMGFSFASLKGPAQAKANRKAVAAAGATANHNLVSQVTQAYVDVLRQMEGLRLAELQLENAALNLELAEGQFEVGAVTSIDVGTAAVQVGRAEVSVLQAGNAVETSRRRLLQQLGITGDPEFVLTTTFELEEPLWEEHELIDVAFVENPVLIAGRANQEAADLGVEISRTAYLPSFSVSTGWSGFTRQASSVDGQIAQARAAVASQRASCETINDLYSRLARPLPPQDCSGIEFTDATRRAIEDANSQFPFSFQGSPPSVSFNVSVPIFQGLGRERNVEAARVASQDQAHQLRERELAVTADILIAVGNVRTAYRSAELESRNRDLADTQLTLARERYQLGVITFVELTNAQTLFAQAERDRAIALFAYHDAVTALEAFVGRRLR
ncbi:MAG: TolC family protein [Gemmatimonadetes bacterium]|nr:TolC family protein [Gemmatimonadota bacterium]